MQLPENVKNIIHTLEMAGFDAYAVGGCVRDTLLSKEPKDWDITTSASPYEVKELFRRTVDTGLKHGTVTIMIGKEGYEVTTYRIDGEYSDGRHPNQVIFTLKLEEDLKRRDFTINAMAYNDRDGLVDLFGGREDLENGIIRCVGKAEERFSEDYLRMLRAVRFSAQLGFAMETETEQAIGRLAAEIKAVSVERIYAELIKLLTSDHPDRILDLYQTGLTKVFLPEFDLCMETKQANPHHCYNVGMHIVKCLCNVRNDKKLRLAALFHDMGKPYVKSTDEAGIDHFHGHSDKSCEIAHQVLKRLNADTETIDSVCRLVKYHDYRIEPGMKAMRHAVFTCGIQAFPTLFELQWADLGAQSTYERDIKTERLKRNEADYAEVTRMSQCMTQKDLAINGSDLITLGMKPGPELGMVLSELLKDVLDEPEHNCEEYLKAAARRLMS